MESKNKEQAYTGFIMNGFVMLGLILLIVVAMVLLIVMAAAAASNTTIAIGAVGAFVLFVANLILTIGLFSQQPNQCRVMIFFGKYRGTFHQTGFFWVNPFMSRKKISLRINNMDIDPIKVNDKIGNPVMIGMVLVWKVKDTYRAVFDVDTPPNTAVVNKQGEITENNGFTKGLNSFVRIQGDAALREVTGHYAYDAMEPGDEAITLRSGGDEINELLENKINDRLAMAGIEVVEARINYLAYAPEIAAVMLRRQQASAIISAREKIVEGAVSMVKMALNQLSADGVVEVDEVRKAAMVSNLLVVLCADEPAQPVVNTGTLYQ